MVRPTFESRLESCEHPLLKKLFKIIVEKQTNLCVAANIQDFETFSRFVDVVGPYVCVLKTQVRNNPEQYKIWDLLLAKKKQHNFLLFEDEKYNDCSETVKRSYKYAVKYADLVTIDHCNQDLFRKLRITIDEARLPVDEPRGFLKLCETSYEEYHTKPDVCFEFCRENKQMCVGIIAQDFNIPAGNESSFVKFTPGVRIDKASDGFDQVWRNPANVVKNGADIIIVGRGITEVEPSEWESQAKLYKSIAYQAYLEATHTTN